MALKLLSKLRHQNLQITRYRNHHRLLAATRLFSDRPVSNLSTTDDSKFIIKNKPQTTTSSLKQHELAKFAAISDTWWDSEGPFKPLHVMNPTRIAFIRSTLCRHFSKDPNCARPFEGLKIVDVGCGGGILSEPLARMGAAVTGVDAVEKNINVARLHADLDPETSTIEYCCTTAGPSIDSESGGGEYTILVIEHVAAPAEFCKSLAALAYPGGATVLSTINRSMKAYATAIVAAEYLLHWELPSACNLRIAVAGGGGGVKLPKGTHQWSSFLTPEELVLILQRASINVKEMAGFVYSPLTGRWSLSDDISVNFIAFGTKDGQ
ncbi:hypothetical protein DKX38_021007 [Salix brachista]|uniref:Ubiquinone biosynthesis O-methyltransferase, mitochondrial n=1 Tax=Salix brachista TaxID=2182728 RepID=A0A5N5KB51_9ROSI|nr:hypothetical protein DKX38_021007 [Salix brachista]